VDEANADTKNNASNTGGQATGRGGDMNADLQLFITTKDKKYADRFQELIWPSLDRTTGRGIFISIAGFTLHGQCL